VFFSVDNGVEQKAKNTEIALENQKVVFEKPSTVNVENLSDVAHKLTVKLSL
jgi:hypothetical protein